MVEVDELFNELVIFFDLLTSTRMANGYNEHVAKYNVDAGNHCLYTDKVKTNEVRMITSICTRTDGCTVDNATIALGNMHNIYELRSINDLANGELMCQKGLWVRYEGDYEQVCFTGVPAGCDLHLYVSGSRKDFPVMGWIIGLPPNYTLPPEQPPGELPGIFISLPSGCILTMFEEFIYDPETNTWTQIANWEESSYDNSAFTIGDFAYVGLGYHQV